MIKKFLLIPVEFAIFLFLVTIAKIMAYRISRRKVDKRGLLYDTYMTLNGDFKYLRKCHIKDFISDDWNFNTFYKNVFG